VSAPPVVDARGVPDLRLWLMDQWRQGRTLHRYAAKALDHQSQLFRRPANPVRFAEEEVHDLQAATLWWVGAEMVELLMAAAAGIPDEVVQYDLPVPSRSGLVVFERPWFGLDTHEEAGILAIPDERAPEGRIAVDAVSWGPRRWSPVDVMGPAAGIAEPAVVHGPVVHQLPTHRLRGGHEPGRAEPGDADRRDRARQAPALHRRRPGRQARLRDVGAAGPFGLADTAPHRRPAVAQLDAAAGGARQLRGGPQGHGGVLDADRAGGHRDPPRGPADPELARVQVVLLRRARRTVEEPEEEHAKVAWSHRWLVEGFWRMQPVGKGRAQRRLTFVRPHVKGPSDKPLVVKQKVHAWTR
jgi:hypothetical protein